MASANVELVRSIYAAWERGDYSSIEWAHPELEFVVADGPEPGSRMGPAGMADIFRGFLSAWEEHRVEAEEYLEVDRERVLVLTRFTGRGKTSGLEFGHMRSETAGVFHVRDGRVTRLALYWSRERALADVGLAEGGSP